MTAILDTSFLFALTDQGDRNHQRVLAIAQSVNEPLVLPVVVLPESCHLIASRLGHQAMRRFVSSMTPDTSNSHFETILRCFSDLEIR
ncbi:MAG: hypothetical protein RPG89_11665 [Microcystis panniformis WG22]|nr:hypothetical protein [Microcystis panniformis WG22]